MIYFNKEKISKIHKPFKRQSHNMVKHAQTIRRQLRIKVFLIVCQVTFTKSTHGQHFFQANRSCTSSERKNHNNAPMVESFSSEV